MAVNFNRRTLFQKTAAVAGVLRMAAAQTAQQSNRKAVPADELPGAELKTKLKVVFVGAHVDDYTVCCAGTIARYTNSGHQALLYSFTPGDSRSMADMNGMPLEELAAHRREDALKGAKILGAELRILDQHNQNMQVNPEVCVAFNKMLGAEKPHVVFGMWPLEFHPDHRAVASISYNAWLQSGMAFRYFFCETPGGGEMTTQHFHPTWYVDVESVMEHKRAAHTANRYIAKGVPDAELLARFRGMEYGCQCAEAFVELKTVAKMPSENITPRRWYYGGLRSHHDY
jgi:LmbE family N-acetylglucosaminyl deacetylase